MTDTALDRLVAEAAPALDSDLASVAIDDALATLMHDVLTGSAEAETLSPRPLRSTRIRFGAALAGCAVVVAVVLLIGIGSGDSPGGTDFASAAVKVAEANPRLLVTAPGWSVSRADEFQVDSGEIEFSDGVHTLQINWSPARYYKVFYRDREEVDPHPRFFDLLGERTRTVAYSDRDFATMLPPEGDVYLEIRSGIEGGGMTFEQYRSLIETLEPVDVDTWLAAMPSTVVQPTDRAAVVDRMLADVPLPPGFDATSLRTENAVLDRYQLAARAINAVTCGWVDEWVGATRSGDGARAQAAVDALQISARAAILDEMAADGAYPQIFRGFVRQFARGQLPGRAAQPLAENISELQHWVNMGFACG